MTAAFALAMLLVLVAAAVFIYLRQRSDLTETIDHGLARRSEDVAAGVQRSGTRLTQIGAGRLTDPEDTFIQVLTPAGRRVDGTMTVREPALAPAEARQASEGPVQF